MLAVEGLVAESVGDLPGKVRARVPTARLSGLPTAVLFVADVCNNGLFDDALLVLLESSGGATWLAKNAASAECSLQGTYDAITTV